MHAVSCRVAVLLSCLFNLFTAGARAQQYPTPGLCLGDCTNIQDTSLIQSDNGTYYLFSAHKGIQIFTAPTLVGPWTSQTPVFASWRTQLSDLIPQIQDLWAPDVHKIGDTYYLFYTVEDFGTAINGYGNAASALYADMAVATSSQLDGGTWTDRGLLGVPENGPRATRIGSSVYVDGSDIYMAYGSYSWGLFGISLKNPPLRVSTNTTTMLVADDPVPMPAGKQPNRTEGSTLWKNNNFYYLFYSDGVCCPSTIVNPGAEYKLRVCRSQNIDGPYNRQDGTSCNDGEGGTILLQSHDDVYAPGSCTVFDDPTYGLVLTYQYMNRTVGIGPQYIGFGWNFLDFVNDWPVLSQTRAGKPSSNATPTAAKDAASSTAAAPPRLTAGFAPLDGMFGGKSAIIVALTTVVITIVCPFLI